MAGWALAFLPLRDWVGPTVLRIVWAVLAVVSPPIVGLLVRWAAPSGVSDVSVLSFAHWEFLFALSALAGFWVLHALSRLREGPAIVQYIADQVPAKNLAPANGTMERYRLQEWLTFIGMEIHRSFGPLFNPASSDEVKAAARDKLAGRLKWVDGELAGKQYLMGDQFTVADGYLFTTTNWAKPTGVDLSGFANLLAYRERVGARPAVQAAMKAEGLLK